MAESDDKRDVVKWTRQPRKLNPGASCDSAPRGAGPDEPGPRQQDELEAKFNEKLLSVMTTLSD